MALDYLAIASRGTYPDPSVTQTQRAAFVATAGLLGVVLIIVSLEEIGVIDATITSLTAVRAIISLTAVRTINSLTAVRTIEGK